MRIFLTGGTGYIGSAIVLELLGQGHDLTLLARDPGKVSAFTERTGISFLKGSLDDLDFICDTLQGYDACIHNATYWDEEPTELELKDTRASCAIFEAAGRANVKHLIYTSSVAVHRPFKPLMSEEDRLQPDDYYGATKACSEMFLSAVSHQYEMRCNVIRPGPTIGTPMVDGVMPNSHSRFKQYLALARGNKDIEVVRGEGRQFVAVADLAKLYSVVLQSSANRQAYLGVSREYTTWEHIAQLTIEAVGSSSRVVLGEGRELGSQSIFDVGRIQREFGLVFETAEALQAHISLLADTET